MDNEWSMSGHDCHSPFPGGRELRESHAAAGPLLPSCEKARQKIEKEEFIKFSPPVAGEGPGVHVFDRSRALCRRSAFPPPPSGRLTCPGES